MMIWYETIAFCEGCLKEAVKYASTTTSTGKKRHAVAVSLVRTASSGSYGVST